MKPISYERFVIEEVKSDDMYLSAMQWRGTGGRRSANEMS